MLEVWQTSISPPGWCRTRPRAVLGWKDIWKTFFHLWSNFYTCDDRKTYMSSSPWQTPGLVMFALLALSEKRAWKALLSGDAYSSEYLRTKDLPGEKFYFCFLQIPISLRPLVSALSYKFIRRGLQTDHVCCWNLLILKGRKAVPNRMNFQKSSKGEGVIFNQKIHIDFGTLNRLFGHEI